MNPQARQLSMLLEDSAKAIAAWTIAAHAERDRTLEARFGANWRTDWTGDVQFRIKYLAQALAVESERLFVDTVGWTSDGFLTRDVPVADLRTSLECMREVMAENLPPAVGEPAAAYVAAALARLSAPPKHNGSAGGDPLAANPLLTPFFHAALHGRRRDAESMVAEALDQGRSIPELFNDLVQPFMVEVGKMWHRNEITVADEHAATAVVEGALAVMRTKLPAVESNNLRVVAAAATGELHALGVRMVADLFELGGWDVLYLGANMPPNDIVHALRSHEAQLLAASVTSPLNLRALGDLIDVVRAQPELNEVKILVGGRPLATDPEVWRRLGADGCADTAGDAVTLGRQLVSDA